MRASLSPSSQPRAEIPETLKCPFAMGRLRDRLGLVALFAVSGASGLLPALPLAHGLAVAVAHSVGAAHIAGAGVVGAAAVGGAAKAAGAAGAAHALGGHGVAGLAGATQSLAQSSLAGVAATGATTASIAVGPEALTRSMRSPDKGENSKAVGRILQIEWVRFQSAFVALSQESNNPVELAQRMHEKAVNRAPIIRWALGMWLRGKVGLQGCGQTGLTIVGSLRALELELATQIKFGLTTAPLRVAKLALSAILLTLFAWLSQIPGFNERLRSTWPRTVEHLATVMERNFEEDPHRSLEVTNRAQRLGAKWRRLFPLTPEIEEAMDVARGEFQPTVDTRSIENTLRAGHRQLFGEPFFDPEAVPERTYKTAW